MMKRIVKKTIEYYCDICGKQVIEVFIRKCLFCGVDVCSNCRSRITKHTKIKKYKYVDELKGYICELCFQQFSKNKKVIKNE